MTMQTCNHAGLKEFVSELEHLLGSDRVLTDEETLELYSVDFSEQRLADSAVVVRPGSREDILGIVALARKYQVSMVPRGASMSYTLGTIPQREGSVIIDLQRLNRVLKIDINDMYIMVEPGVTWAQISDALNDYDYEIPFLGTFSGIRATVGGGLGSCAVGFGKGDITDYLLGLEVVLPDGRLLQTGALAANSAHPGLNCYGPDLTRLFVNDGGSLGIKVKACFRLERKPGGSTYRSWGFNDEQQALELTCEIGRLGVATDVFLFGPYHHKVFRSRPKPGGDDIRHILREVVRRSSGYGNMVRNMFDLARGGNLGFLAKWSCTLHVSVDGVNQVAADAAMKSVQRLAKRTSGSPVPPSLFLVLRTMPFGPIDDLMVGLDGEICFPSNCTVALSQGLMVKRALDEFFEEHSEFMCDHGITVARLYLSTKHAFGVEPIIYWKDRMNALRYSVLNDERKRRFGNLPDNMQARKAAVSLRRKMVDEVFARFRPAHVQIGKYYPYREAMQDQDCWNVLRDIKSSFDPDGLMNPGALGLE